MHTWGKSEGPGRITLGRIFNIATLVIAIVAVYLALKRPRPVALPQTPAALAANAQSFQTKLDQLAQAPPQGQSGSEVRLSADEISAAISQASGNAAPAQTSSESSGAPNNPLAAVAPGSADQANLGEPLVSLEGDVMKGQFVTEVAGKKVYITVAGHLGSKDGYATFEPTEFKVGDLNVPVSLVNEALQKKIIDQRDRLKLPEFVSEVKVENGQLVVKQK